MSKADAIAARAAGVGVATDAGIGAIGFSALNLHDHSSGAMECIASARARAAA